MGLQAITFVLWFMKHSFRNIGENEAIPFFPFSGNEDEPSVFHIIFSKKTIIDGNDEIVDYEYYLKLTRECVLYEKLTYHHLSQEIKAYNRDGEKILLGDSVPSSDYSLFDDGLRNNCSIVSYASLFKSQKIAKNCINYDFTSNVTLQGMSEIQFDNQLIKDICNDTDMKKRVSELLKMADVGIEDFEFFKISSDELNEVIKQFELKKQNNKIIDFLEEVKKDGWIETVLFSHNLYSEKRKFDSDNESSGTLQFIALCHKILTAFDHGSLLILDEIELKLHQDLIAYIVGLFQNEEINKHKSQLIFSFHNSLLMNILSPEQLWFSEKDDNGNTELFSAIHFDDIDHIHEKNLEKLYRIGRFGAKPRGLGI